MMKAVSFSSGLLIFISWTAAVQARCSSDLLIDNYSKYSSNTNSLGQYTSDDGSTTNFRADIANGKISFTTSTSSYFYTTFVCETASSLGYNAITFPVKGPSGASLSLELQTSEFCSTTSYSSYYYVVPTKMTGNTLIASIPLSAFAGANLNAIRAVVFESFTNGAWEIGLTQLVCANTPSSSISKLSTLAPLTSSTSILSTVSSSTKISSTASSTVLSATKSSSLISSRSSSTTRSSISMTISATAGSCTSLLVDDFSSQSRLTFLFYNAMLLPSSDDGTMKPVSGRVDTTTSVIVTENHVTLTPVNSASYFYTMLGCPKTNNIYGGIGLKITAPAGTVITVEFQTSTTCSSDNPVLNDVASTTLGWTFDGTEKFYAIPFNKFPGLDADSLIALLFSGFTKAVTLGPIAFYCGTTAAPYPLVSAAPVTEPSSTIPATIGPSAFVIDSFTNPDTNNLGFYHGGDDTTTYQIADGKLNFHSNGNSDVSWYTQVGIGCVDFTPNDNAYLHIAFTGSNEFTISLQQHNSACNESVNPFPYTWDSVEASRYSNTAKTDIFVPISHFNINRKLAVGFAVKGFYTSMATVFSKIEIVKTVPNGFLVPSKLDTAPLKFACTRPNSFAFAIDDGSPEFAQQVISYVKAANILVTFFTVGAPLLDATTNFTGVYTEMLSLGHQVAYHSFTHPPMEGLPSLSDIDDELSQDIEAVSRQLGITSIYFRPPFGTEGARVRQRLAASISGSQFVAWSVDVQDYLWATGPTPEKQLASFQSDVNSGGNLVVCHYLYQTTVDYIPQFIDIAKRTGKQLMRVDQCMEDPDAPPL